MKSKKTILIAFLFLTMQFTNAQFLKNLTLIK